jgi:hypothetical protein
MKATITFITWLGLILTSLSVTADTVHYIGFNKFRDSKDSESAAAFDSYIGDLLPIMARYGMVLEVYSVVHGGSETLDADVLTFGTAPDMEAFQQFFQDPQLQQIMPTLIGALSGHQVVFTAGEFMPSNSAGGHLMLQLDWLKDGIEGSDSYHEQLAGYAPAATRYGVTREAASTGIMSNRGLAAEVVEVEAPQAMMLWRMRDAHGFFDDPQVIRTNRQIDALVSHSEAFWLKSRRYD